MVSGWLGSQPNGSATVSASPLKLDIFMPFESNFIDLSLRLVLSPPDAPGGHRLGVNGLAVDTTSSTL